MTSAPYDPDPRVDQYIDALPDWQQAICHQVRELVHAADLEVQETIKRKVQPYFVLQGNICALLATKDHVNVFLYDGAIVPDPEGIITGATTTRQPGWSPSTKANRSTPRRCARCSSRSSPTTAQADGASSNERPERLSSPLVAQSIGDRRRRGCLLVASCRQR